MMVQISNKLSTMALETHGPTVQILSCIESLLELSRALCKTISVTPQSAAECYYKELDESIFDAILECRFLVSSDTEKTTSFEPVHREFGVVDSAADVLVMVNQIIMLCPNYEIQDLINLRERKLLKKINDVKKSLTGEEIDLLNEPRTKRCLYCGSVYHYNAIHECEWE